MAKQIRGADIVAQTLARAGHKSVFTLSGNHIMPVFDATIGTGIELVHVRHEAAAVHMADAYARLTGDVGIALVTGGQGHTNAVAALTTAQSAEAPLVLLSGHAGLNELGRGAFQELAQAELARPVTKASWTVQSTARLGTDLADAIGLARSGRPGPVHLSLPFDLLEARIEDTADLWPPADAMRRRARPCSTAAAHAVVALLAKAKRPLILAGPMLCSTAGRLRLDDLATATGVPAIGMESPRGVNDPGLGAFAEILKQADLLVLLGKPHDFTLRFAEPPFVDATAQFIVVDPDVAMIDRAVKEKGARVALTLVADADAATGALIEAARHVSRTTGGWRDEVDQALGYRPQSWSALSGSNGRLHPVVMCRGLAAALQRDSDAILIADGGEIGQWAQSCLSAPRRLINGIAGSIGASLPFAIAARLVEKHAPIIAVMGDGTFGFHMAEFDTAVRHDLPFVAVVGNDANWNAEHQIQLRDYGAERTHGLALLATRYDQIAIAMGGHGEFVTAAADIEPAVERAIASNKPACVNVMIESHAAPVVRRN